MDKEKIIDKIFKMLENGKEFEQLNSMITMQCEERMQPFRERLSPQEYEQIRDVVFSVAYLVQKPAFGIGFRTAVELVLECREDDYFT